MSCGRALSLAFLTVPILLLAQASSSTAGDYPWRFKSWRPITQVDWDVLPNPDLNINHAVILLDLHIIDDSNDSKRRTVRSHYRRIKVFDDEGIEEFQTVEISYTKKAKIKGLRARTIKPDGSSIKVKKDEIHEKTLFSFGKRRLRAKVFAFKGVEAGDILEYRFEYHAPSLLPPLVQVRQRHQCVESSVIWWYYPQPESYLNYTEQMLDRAVFKPGCIIPNGQNFPYEFAEFPASGTSEGLHVAFSDLPPLPDEPYMPAEEYVAVLFAGFYEFPRLDKKKPFWERMAEGIGEQTNEFCNAGDRLTEWMAGIISNERDLEQDLQACFDLIHRDIGNVDILDDHELPKKVRECEFIEDLLEYRCGTSYDINRLLVAMLRELGHAATVFWVRDREEGPFIPQWKTFRQFTLGGVAVKGEQDIQYCFPAYPIATPSSLPWQVCGCKGFFQDVSGERRFSEFRALMDIPLAPKGANQATVDLNLRIDDLGILTGRLNASWGCSHNLFFLQRIARERDRDSVIEELRDRVLQSDLNWTAIDDSFSTNPTSVLYSCSLRVDGLVEYAGSRLLCTLEDIRCDDYDMPSESRETYIDFHYPRRNASRVHLTIPEGYVVEDVPPDHELSRNFAIFRSVYRQDEGMISFERDIEIPFSRYTERDAEDFNKCFGDMYAASDQPIILKREDSDE